MPNPIESLLQAANLPSHNLPASSRYYHVETTMIEGSGQQPVIYLRRRFVPPPDYYFGQQTHKVQEGERLDNITAKYLGSPEQFWQIADANLAMNPEEVTEETGRLLRIPQGYGISG